MNESARPGGFDWALCARYLAHELSPVEREHFEAWVAEEAGRQAELAELRRLWDDVAALPAPVRVRTLWYRVKRGMARNQGDAVGDTGASDDTTDRPGRARGHSHPPSG